MTEILQVVRRIQTDEARERPLAQLWEELTRGTVLIVEHFNLDGRCYALLRRKPPRATKAGRDLEILRRVLLGEAQKVIALELRLSNSAVAVAAAQCARAMGLACSARRIPAVVYMAAQAKELARPVQSRWQSLDWNGVEYLLVSAPRPTAAAIGDLSDAERHIADLLVDRLSNAEIARIRRTSARTVANQLARVQQKLQARGRVEVLSRLIAGGAGEGGRVRPVVISSDTV